jgi:hypothetical protein
MSIAALNRARELVFDGMRADKSFLLVVASYAING